MTTQTPTDTRLDPEVVRIATAVIAGGVAVILDSTIVTVALKELGTTLHASVDTIQWVSTGYLLAMFVAIPASGWLQARFGGKRLWLGALGVFLLGSLLCACAWDVWSLIAFRVLQGLGGGLMLPLMTTLIMQAARGQSLGRLMAVVGLPAMVGPIVGPVLGGVLVNGLGWRWIFVVNLPICAVGAYLAMRRLPDDTPRSRTSARFDAVGFALVTPGVVGVIYGLSNVARAGGVDRSDVWLPFAAGLVLVAAFTGWAWHRRERALVDVRLMRHRPLAVATFLLFLTGATLYGAMLLLPLFWQEVHGHDALGAGLLLIPQGVGALLSRSIGGRASDDISPRWVAVIGFAVVAVTTVPFALSSVQTPSWWLLIVLLLRGIGLGVVFTPIMSVAYVGLEPREMPDASIITRVAQQLGGSFGTAVLAVVLVRASAHGGGLGALADGFDRAFWWAVGLAVLAAALSVMLPARPVGRR